MRGAGDSGRFEFEALQGGGIACEFGFEQLEGDFALQRDLFGQVNLSHAAFAETTEDLKIAERAAGQIDRGRDGCRAMSFGRQGGFRQVLHDRRLLPRRGRVIETRTHPSDRMGLGLRGGPSFIPQNQARVVLRFGSNSCCRCP